MAPKPHGKSATSRSRRGSIDFKAINDAALSLYPQLLTAWFSKGKLAGSSFLVGNLKGDPGKSLSVNLNTGVWKDFSTGEGGKDPVSLNAARCGLKQGEAARRLAKELGVSPSAHKIKKNHLRSCGGMTWRPVLPVPDDGPAPPQLKNCSASWAYKDQKGRLLGYTIRHDRSGKKLILPLTYWESANGKRAWRTKALPRPRLMYGLDRLAQWPDKHVLIVEGEKAADAAQELLPDYVVVTWPGGCQAVAHTDWSVLEGCQVSIWPDNDKPGETAALAVSEELRAVGVSSLRICRPPSGVRDGWDLADALEQDWTTERVRRHMKEHSEILPREIQPDPSRIGSDVLSKPPFRALGHDQGQFFIYSNRARQLVVTSANGLTNRGTLLSFAPLSYWQQAFSGNRDFGITDAVDFVINSCYEAGVFDPTRMRGRGVWHDGDQIVLHLGDRLIVDSVPCALEDFESTYLYPSAPPLDVDLSTPLEDSEAESFHELCLSLPWERPTSGWLLAGWCTLAPICGILPWRPHIWITGSAGTGKTWLLEHIVQPASGSLAFLVQSKTTEAGLRQSIGSDARPVIFDEAESEDPRARDRLQGVIELARASSSEEGTDIVKGSASGQSKRYKTRSCFAFSSINANLSHFADKSRITVLSLLSLDQTDPELQPAQDEQFTKLRARQKQVVTSGFSDRLLARLIRLAPMILDNARTLSEAAAGRFGSRRLADQIGVLLAGSMALKSSDRLGETDATALIDSLDWSDHLPRRDEGDEQRLLNYVLQHLARLTPGSGPMIERSIGELIAIACGSKDNLVSQDEAEANLKRSGIRVDAEAGRLLISNSHRSIGEALRDTPWAKNWSRVLKRLPGATVPRDPVRFTAVDKSRAVSIPLDLVLDQKDTHFD